MLNDQIFKELLAKYQVRPDLFDFFKLSLRSPIENAINRHFSKKPNYRYGGSLAKGTANSDSCDVDLLVYFDSDFEMNVPNIYREVTIALQEAGYLIEKKNSAIKVFGKDNSIWDDIAVDVVPGKFSSDDSNKDVYLYCNKEGSKLKSNPEKQIGKIQSSEMKQVIRLIKLLRQKHNFVFKSFYLELFAADIVEPNLKEDASLIEKLFQFSKRFAEIGVTKVCDPANPTGNNIMDIHSEFEFQTIRKYIKTLYEVMLTDDEKLVVDYLTNNISLENIENRIIKAYEKSAKAHSHSLELTIGYFGMPTLSLSCRIKNTSNYLVSGQTVCKNTYLLFEVNKSTHYDGYSFKFIVSNAGYEARVANQPRGKAEDPDASLTTHSKYVREEHTLYNGNHYVQVVGTHLTKSNLYSIPFIVKVRDFE